MLFTILCKKGPQITVTAFIERTSKFFLLLLWDNYSDKEKLNECHEKKVVFFFY